MSGNNLVLHDGGTTYIRTEGEKAPPEHQVIELFGDR